MASFLSDLIHVLSRQDEKNLNLKFLQDQNYNHRWAYQTFPCLKNRKTFPCPSNWAFYYTGSDTPCLLLPARCQRDVETVGQDRHKERMLWKFILGKSLRWANQSFSDWYVKKAYSMAYICHWIRPPWRFVESVWGTAVNLNTNTIGARRRQVIQFRREWGTDTYQGHITCVLASLYTKRMFAELNGP